MQSSLKSSPIQTITLDGRLFHDRESFFDEMVRIFDLPSYFGRNLDALYDSLSEYGVSVLILWQFHEVSKQWFIHAGEPGFFDEVVAVFQDVEGWRLQLI